VKILEDKEGVIGDISGDDAPIKGRSTNLREAPAERISTDSEEIARVLTSMDAATVLVGELMFPLVVVPFPLVNTPRCDEDRLEIMELMVFLSTKLMQKMELTFDAVH
nr:hypothetical protein [Tanacetum cinerariifolium]